MKEIVLAVKFMVGKETTEQAKKECSRFIYRRINKAEILEYLEEKNKKISKDDLVEKILELPQEDIRYFACFFANQLTLHPLDVQELLNITKTERLRWTDDKKLQVLGYEDFKYGSYPVYDLVSTALIPSETIEKWRSQHLKTTQQHRREGIQKAAQTKKDKCHQASDI